MNNITKNNRCGLRAIISSAVVAMACLPGVGQAAPTVPLEVPWTASWIGPERGEVNMWVCYRKTFDVGVVPSSVPARLAVDTKYWMWINGKLAVFEGGLKRGPTPTDGYYDTIDLAPFLQRGSNTIAVLVWYFGKEGFAHKSSGKPGLVFEAKLSPKPLVSDGTWKMMVHPAFGTAGDPKPNFRLAESSILFDAGKDMPGWMNAGFNDSSWVAPVAAGVPPAAPWGKLVQRPIPFWKDSGLKEYVNPVTLPLVSDGNVVKAALPYNAQVTPYFKIDAPAGVKIDIRTDNIQGGGEFNVHAEYITRAGVQEFECFGWMNGHDVHYTIPAGVKVLALRYRETGYNAEFVGSFKCDDPFFNELWQKAKRTLYVTMRDNYMDCPDRERAQWWGDAVNEIGESFYVFDQPANLLARKGILELMNWQRADKTIFSPIPAGNWDKELSVQMLASVGKYGFWTYYYHTGDAATIRAVYPRVRDYLNLWKLDGDGLVVHRNGGWDWSDWGREIDARLLDSVWYHLALQGAVEMAKVCGATADIAGWQTQMATVKNAVNTKCWTGKEYRGLDYKGSIDDRGNGLAVVAGIAGPDKYPALREVLTKQQYASPYMEKYVLEALFLMGDAQLGLDRMKQRHEGMVKRPISTLPELMDGGGTYNHAWSGGPLTMMSQYVLGVAPDSIAYASYHVLPQMGSIKSIEAVVPTLKGNIKVSLKREAARFGLNLTSPEKTHALVGIPVEKGRRIVKVDLNGKTVWQAGKAGQPVRGLVCKGEDASFCRFEVAPGKWDFSAVYE